MSVPHAVDEVMRADQFPAWREGQVERHELVDGRVFVMAAERAIHARMKYAMTRALERAIGEAGLSCEAFVDGMAVRVDEWTVFEPDALVRCGARLPAETTVIVDPVIVVEVASPQRVDVLLKLTRYLNNFAIQHYLIVLLSERSVLHHRRASGGTIETTIMASGRLNLDPPGLAIEIDTLFPTD